VIRSFAGDRIIAEDFKRTKREEVLRLEKDKSNNISPKREGKRRLIVDLGSWGHVNQNIYVDNLDLGFVPILKTGNERGQVVLCASKEDPKKAKFSIFRGDTPSKHRCTFIGEFTALGEFTASVVNRANLPSSQLMEFPKRQLKFILELHVSQGSIEMSVRDYAGMKAPVLFKNS
jgi:hypothetical protein